MSQSIALLSNRQGFFPGATGISPQVVATVTVMLAVGTINAGQTDQAIATARDSDGNIVNGRAVVWSSVTPAIATVDPSTGLVTGVSSGTAVIIATIDGVSGNASLTVNTIVVIAPVASVSVTLVSSIERGTSVQAGATPRDASGNPLSGRTVTWSSSNNSIATVDSNGLVTGVSDGNVFIIATCEGVQGSAPMTIVPPIDLGNFTNQTFLKTLFPELDMLKPGSNIIMSYRFNANQIPDIGHGFIQVVTAFGSDPSAPISPVDVGTFPVDIGAIGGGVSDSTFPINYLLGDDNTENGPVQKHELVISKVFKILSPFEWPGSNDQKVWVLFETDGATAGLHWLQLTNQDPGSVASISPASGLFSVIMTNQSGGMDSTNYASGSSGAYYTMAYDSWHKLTVRIKQSSSFGSPDGIYQVLASSFIGGRWTTPVMAINVTNTRTRGAQQAHFSMLSDNWMWGGGGVATIRSVRYTDHLIIAT